MTKGKKILIGVVIGFLTVSVLVGGLCWWQLNAYYDKNSWASISVFEEDETIEVEIPAHDEEKLYLKGEALPISFAEVSVDKVRHSGKVTLSTDADILYNDEINHKVTLSEGESCVISKGDDSVTVIMYKCYYQ